MQKYNGTIPCCGIECNGCPNFIQDKKISAMVLLVTVKNGDAEYINAVWKRNSLNSAMNARLSLVADLENSQKRG